jgi:hypothetical protein
VAASANRSLSQRALDEDPERDHPAALRVEVDQRWEAGQCPRVVQAAERVEEPVVVELAGDVQERAAMMAAAAAYELSTRRPQVVSWRYWVSCGVLG